MNLPVKLLPDSCYTQGKPKVWLVPVTRRAYTEFVRYNFVSYRAMWAIEDDLMYAANKFDVLNVLEHTPAFARASEQMKRLAAGCMFDWIRHVKPHDYVVCFLGVGHVSVGEILGPCKPNLDAETVLFKYAKPARWSDISLPVGGFNASEQRVMASLREHVRKLDNLLATRLLVATLIKAEHWTDPVLRGIAARFSDEYLHELNPQRFAELLQSESLEQDTEAGASIAEQRISAMIGASDIAPAKVTEPKVLAKVPVTQEAAQESAVQVSLDQIALAQNPLTQEPLDLDVDAAASGANDTTPSKTWAYEPGLAKTESDEQVAQALSQVKSQAKSQSQAQPHSQTQNQVLAQDEVQSKAKGKSASVSAVTEMQSLQTEGEPVLPKPKAKRTTKAKKSAQSTVAFDSPVLVEAKDGMCAVPASCQDPQNSQEPQVVQYAQALDPSLNSDLAKVSAHLVSPVSAQISEQALNQLASLVQSKDVASAQAQLGAVGDTAALAAGEAGGTDLASVAGVADTLTADSVKDDGGKGKKRKQVRALTPKPAQSQLEVQAVTENEAAPVPDTFERLSETKEIAKADDTDNIAGSGSSTGSGSGLSSDLNENWDKHDVDLAILAVPAPTMPMSDDALANFRALRANQAKALLEVKRLKAEQQLREKAAREKALREATAVAAVESAFQVEPQTADADKEDARADNLVETQAQSPTVNMPAAVDAAVKDYVDSDVDAAEDFAVDANVQSTENEALKDTQPEALEQSQVQAQSQPKAPLTQLELDIQEASHKSQLFAVRHVQLLLQERYHGIPVLYQAAEQSLQLQQAQFAIIGARQYMIHLVRKKADAARLAEEAKQAEDAKQDENVKQDESAKQIEDAKQVEPSVLDEKVVTSKGKSAALKSPKSRKR